MGIKDQKPLVMKNEGVNDPALGETPLGVIEAWIYESSMKCLTTPRGVGWYVVIGCRARSWSRGTLNVEASS